MLQSLRKSKNANEKRQLLHNILNNSRLQTSLISRVFATHFEVGGLHASYERHFVKKIQQQLSYHIVCHPKLESLMLTLYFVRLISTTNSLVGTIGTPFVVLGWCEGVR